MITRSAFIRAAVGLSAVALASVAVGADAPSVPHIVQSGANKFSIESADGQYAVSLTGRVHFDVGGYSFSPQSSVVGPQILSGGANARRARIGVSGKTAGGWVFNFIYDGGNSQDSSAAGIQSAQISYTGFKGVQIDLPGYSEPPYPLETAQSSNDIMFLERAAPVNVANGLGSGDFRANTGVRFFGDRYWVGVYLTGPAQGDSHTAVHERFGSFQRASAQVYTSKDATLHLGVNAFELLQVPDTGVGTAKTVTLSDRPELRIDPTALLSTGAIGSVANPVTGANVYGFEAAGNYQSFYSQAEYFKYDVTRRGLGSDSFNGYYALVSYTLTGERRSYNRATGAYGAITPSRPLSVNGGRGAVELAARYSYTNLTDGFTPGIAQSAQPQAVNGGKMKNVTIGATWYVNSYLRFMLNYVHSELEKANGTAVTGAPLGAPVGYKSDGVALRTQLTW